jgi:hypothetical protein
VKGLFLKQHKYLYSIKPTLEYGVNAEMISITDTFRAIADNETLELFTAFVHDTVSDNFTSRTKLPRRRYSSRMRQLMKAGLIRRQGGDYFLTSYGIVVHNALKTVERAAKDWWKLKVIDSIEIEMEGNLKVLPKDGRNKIIDTIIEDPEVKDMLVSYYDARTALAATNESEEKVRNKG